VPIGAITSGDYVDVAIEQQRFAATICADCPNDAEPRAPLDFPAKRWVLAQGGEVNVPDIRLESKGTHFGRDVLLCGRFVVCKALERHEFPEEQQQLIWLYCIQDLLFGRCTLLHVTTFCPVR
jgi:hypothetical protein